MALPHITYTLNGKTYNADSRTLGLSDVKLITELESKQKFFRTKWQGDITFVGKDFDLFYALSKTSCCQPVTVSLYRTGAACSNASAFWAGIFNLSDLKFNVDAAQARLVNAPKPDDGYQTLLENWDTTFNWLDINTVKAFYSSDRTVLYRRARLLTQLLAGMVNFTLKDTRAASLTPVAGTDVISVFLEAPLNPVTRQKNTLLGAVVLQASDFTTPGLTTGMAPSTGFATKAELSLKQLVDDLQALFCLYPYIDPATGKLRWEHESFFPWLTYDAPPVGLSLPDSRPEWNGRREFSTAPEDLYGKYTLTIQPNKTISPDESKDQTAYQFPVILNNPYGLPDVPGANQVDGPSVATDFSVASIYFTDACVTRGEGESASKRLLNVNQICTYPAIARQNPSYVDKASWLFLFALSASPDINNPVPQIAMGVVDTQGENTENGILSASSLVRDYHRHNKPFFEGFFNKSAKYLPKGIRRGMLSIAPVRKLSQITIPYCCTDESISLSGQIETWLGTNGQLERAEYNLATEQMSLEFAHPGPCQITANGPFDPNGNPLACPAKGTFLRIEQLVTYPENNTSAYPCRIDVSFIYADGACGEYAVTNVKDNGAC